jgi:hypothetical protein
VPNRKTGDCQKKNGTYYSNHEALKVEAYAEASAYDELHDHPAKKGPDNADDEIEAATLAPARDLAGDPTGQGAKDYPRYQTHKRPPSVRPTLY